MNVQMIVTDPSLLLTITTKEAQALLEEIEKYAPQPNGPGLIQWDKIPTISRIHDALRDFINGHLTIEDGAIEYEVS